MASKAPVSGGKKPVKKSVGAATKSPAKAPSPAPKAPVAETVAVEPTAPAPVVETAPEPLASEPAAAEQVIEAATAEPEPATAPIVEPAVEAAVAAEIIEDTASQSAEIAAKGSDIMEATIEKTQAMFADMNERAKAAVEKNTKLVSEATEFAKGNVEALVESGKIAAKGFETMGQDAAEYSRKSFESATATLKSMSSVKSPADFFKLQSDFMRQSFDSVVAESSKNTEAFIKLAGDAVQPISSRFALAVEKVKAAA